jgi:hypothetical protein
MDRERISRLEALLARVKARTDEPRSDEQSGLPLENEDTQNGTTAESAEQYEEAELIEDLPTDDVAAPARFPAESSTLQALPPPPPDSSNSAFAAPDSTPAKPEVAAQNSSPASLEEAFEQYEMVSEVVELTPDADDDAVRPSVPAPILSDDMFDEAELPSSSPQEEFQSQQRLVVAPSAHPTSAADDGELEVLGEADLDGDDDVMDVRTDDLLLRTAELDDVPSGRPTRQAEEMIATILSTGLDAPPENANRPVLQLQDEDDLEEPPPSSRRPVSHEEAHEQELTFENDPPPPPMTPPPESGRQVALPDLSSTSLTNAFEADFTGVGNGVAGEPSVVRAPLAENSGVAIVVGASASRAKVTFGELIDLALSI